MFPTMPQTISSLSDVQKVLKTGLVVYCANEGETFCTLITTRKGSFLNASGNYYIEYVHKLSPLMLVIIYLLTL